MRRNIRLLLALAFCGIVGLAHADPFGQVPGSRFATAPNRAKWYEAVRPFPVDKMYENLGLAAPPNRLIEFFVSPRGSDNDDVTGLTPGNAFATPQHCLNYIMEHYSMNGVEPICRLMNPNGASGTTYTGAVQMTGPLPGRQIEGGGLIIFWGTCPITGSPWNDQVGFVSGSSDVTLQSNASGTLFSFILGAGAQISCLTASADVYTFYAQQFAEIFINSSVRVVAGPTGNPSTVLAADHMGQILAAGMTVTASAGSFALASNGAEIAFYSPTAGNIIFSGTPTYTTFLVASTLGHMSMSGAAIFTGAITATNKCSVTYNAVINAAGGSGSLPGSGTCATSTGGQVN